MPHVNLTSNDMEINYCVSRGSHDCVLVRLIFQTLSSSQKAGGSAQSTMILSAQFPELKYKFPEMNSELSWNLSQSPEIEGHSVLVNRSMPAKVHNLKELFKA